MNRVATIAIQSATLLALAGSALAQQDRPLEGDFDRPLVVRGQPLHEGASQVVIVQTDPSGTYKVTIKNGEASAEANGKSVPATRLRQKGDVYEILDEQGSVIATLHAPKSLTGIPFWNREGHALLPGQPPVAPEAKAEQPRVMMGIRMNTNENDEIVVESVLEGLPAAKAGLEDGDILLRVDGKNVENTLSMRSILRDKQPGDKVDVVVRRDGEEKTVTLKLQAYAQEKLGQAGGGAVVVPGQPGQNWTTTWRGLGDAGGRWGDDARKAIEDALRQMKDSPNGKDFRDQARKALEQALASLNEMPEGMDKAWRGLIVTPEGGVAGPEGGRHVFRLGAPDDLEQRLDRLDKQLDRLSRRLEELSKRLEEKGGR